MNDTAIRGASFVVPPLTVFALLYHVLAGLQITMLRLETLVAVALSLGLAGAAGLVAALGGERIRAAVLALTTAIWIDATFDLTAAAGTAAAPLAAGLAVVTAGLALLFWRLRAHVAQILLVFIAAAAAVTIARQPRLNFTPPGTMGDDGAALAEAWRDSGPFDERLPVVLHLLADEMMSPGAIDPTLPGAAATREAMYAFGRLHGFRLHDAVYSRFFYTGVVMPNLMNGEYTGHVDADDLVRTVVNRLDANAYFADMASRGYRTVVFQNSAMDYCASPDVQRCETFPSYDPGAVDTSLLDSRARPAHLWDTIFRAYAPGLTSTAGRWLLQRIHGLSERDLVALGAVDRFDIHGFPGSFDRFGAFVRDVPRGTHVFAHFLTPHAPYGLTDTCRIAGAFSTGYYLGRWYPEEDARAAARQTYFESYLEQAQCVTSKIDELMRSIADVPALSDATIVIHGDHGSRITTGDMIEDHTTRDFLDNYGTFFAVRAPDVPPGLDCDLMSLPQAFRAVMQPDADPAGDEPLPVLAKTRSDEDALQAASMPAFGCAVDE